RHDPDVTRECGSDLEDDEVLGIVDPAATCFVRRSEPRPTDEDQHDVALAHCLFYSQREVEAGLDRVDVHEDVRVPEPRCKLVVQPARHVPGVRTPIADEDASRSRLAHRLASCRVAAVLWAMTVPTETADEGLSRVLN